MQFQLSHLNRIPEIIHICQGKICTTQYLPWISAELKRSFIHVLNNQSLNWMITYQQNANMVLPFWHPVILKSGQGCKKRYDRANLNGGYIYEKIGKLLLASSPRKSQQKLQF